MPARDHVPYDEDDPMLKNDIPEDDAEAAWESDDWEEDEDE